MAKSSKKKAGVARESEPNPNPSKYHELTVRVTTIKDSVGRYVAPGGTAYCEEKLARQYADAGLGVAALPKLDLPEPSKKSSKPAVKSADEQPA